MHYIGLMDCNNFFVSCERLFRPDLWKKPVAVLSSNDGCIVARSQEVKDLGIPMGIPYFKVKEICEKEGITLFSSNFKLYRDISARVMGALREEFDRVEVYSVDEAFFEVPETVKEATITEIRARIMRKTGIPVSFGIGNTKTIAKAASEYAKKGSGVCILDLAAWKGQISTISCGSIWGIGRQTTAKLERAGIRTVADFLAQGMAYYREEFGVVGERMYHELSGVSVHGLGDRSETDIEQSITSTRSFSRETHELQVLESALSYHVTHVGEKLRERGHVAGTLRIIAAPSRYSDFALRRHSARTELTVPTSDTAVLLKESLRLLRDIFDPEVPYKKAGVVLGGIMPALLVSGALFTDEAHEKTGTIYRVIDVLNDKFGRGTVRPAVIFGEKTWGASARLRSNEYTTRWGEIAVVRAK